MDAEPLNDLIRALARADWDAVDTLVVEIGEHGLANGLQVIGAVFATAVHRYFGPQSTPTNVAAWVAAVRAEHPDSDPLPALEMEGLIRAALGEYELIDTIPAETALGAELFILGQLLLELNLDPQEVDEFVAESEDLAAEQL